jgi:AcrR family transcriptional regulator
MVRVPEEEIGLRERKKLRTRRAIERVGLDLFARTSFQETTLAEIAKAAEVAPSTLHA